MKTVTVKLALIGLLSSVVIQSYSEEARAWVSFHAPNAERGKNGGIVKNAGLFQEHVTLRGEKIAEEPLRGFGRGEEVQDAINAILGRKWPVRWGGVNPRTHVTWSTKGTRADTLDHLAKLYGFIVEIDWKKPLVTVLSKGYRGAFSTVAPDERIKEYKTLSALSLKENIVRWGAEGIKWHVIWRARWNARIPVEESFGSDFRKAVIRIISAANKNGGTHFIVDFYPHRVIVIGDRQ